MEVSPAQVTWSSSNANVLSVSSDGVARAVGAGSASVRATVSSVTGQANVAVQVALIADLPTAGLAGSVTLPPGVRPEVVSVLAGAAGVSSVAADGSFQIQKSTAVETALLAVQNGKLFGIAIAAAGDSGSASRVSVNAQSTALALVFLSPAFAVAPAGITRELLQLLGGVSEVGQLAQYLDGQVQTRGALPDSTDAQFVALYRSAVTAAEARLSQVAGVGSIRALVLAGIAGPVSGSGITMTPPASITPNISVQFQNAYGRDAHLYVHEADTAGRPATSLSGLTFGTALDGRLSLGAADYVPNLSSISSWVTILRGQYGAATPRSVPVTFSPQSPRYVAYAYGLGIKNWSANTSVVNGAENLRWVVPAVHTAVMSYVIPVLEILSGIEFIKPGTLSQVQTTLEVVDVIARGIQWRTCIDRQGDAVGSPALLVCTGDQVVIYLRNHPEILHDLLIESARMVGRTIESSTAEAIVRNSLWPLRVLSLVSGVGRVVVTTYALVESDLRTGFDLSYNDLLGAWVVAKDSGDSQQGVANEALDRNVVVKVTNSGGAAVSAGWVRWSVDAGGGIASQPFDTTDASGRASVRWTLGTSGTQTLSAVIAGTGRLVRFAATVVPPTVPSVTSVTPNSGPVAGGTSVTVDGANFLNVLGVTVGGNPLGNRNVVSSTRITGTTPASSPAGLKDVVVTTAGGSGTCTGCFTYYQPVVWTSLTGGDQYSCGLRSGGAAYCWGSNSGELGDGSTTSRVTPVAVVAGGITFASLTAGSMHTCGLTSGGAAYCWGGNSYGEVGDSSTISRTTPVAVAGGLTFASLTAGHRYTCGLTSGAAAYCWGTNESGELGDGSTSWRSSTPVSVAGGITFASVTAGRNHACGLTSAGAAYCWGYNLFGQLGDGSTTARATPVAVAGGLTFSSVTAGGWHTCGLTSGGAAYCWGANEFGQLGNGSSTTYTMYSSPVAVVGGISFSSLRAGGIRTCGLTSGGAAYCWGSGPYGEMGVGINRSGTPVAVTGGLTFTSLAAGWQHTCGLTNSGAAYCWGWNSSGQLGDSTTTDRTSPVVVVNP
jgi:alpha-tubulin suppressor-like RCC1 family protein